MAKDPAILWYWGDWYSGTVLLSRFLKGCYMDLLHAQFNNGPLSLDEVKAVLGGDFGQAWPTLQKKFSVDPKGFFFNDRLESEKQKRKAYSDSRRKNREKKTYVDTYDGTYVKDMSLHMENENENEISSKRELNELEAGKTVEYCRITLSRNYDIRRVRELWVAFCIQHPTHPSEKEKLRHFRNWIKTQDYSHGAVKKMQL